MIACNRGCGSLDLKWKIVDTKFKLFGGDNLLHICNDGNMAKLKIREVATAKILYDLGFSDCKEIPDAEATQPDKEPIITPTKIFAEVKIDPKHMFTINTTANGIALTGDDKHNAIYLPKIAISELLKALVDFI